MEAAIFALARPLCSAGEEQLRAMCRAARAWLAARLKPGLTPEGCGEDFLLAAALLACAGCEGELAGFTVGEVSVSMRAGGAGSSLRRAAVALAAPYLEEDGTCFLRMKG